LKLVDQSRSNWQNRAHFLGVASGLMRRILVDHGRAFAVNHAGAEETELQ
jgi:hypothetical protein